MRTDSSVQENSEGGRPGARPEIFVVMAVSADGKIASANRRIQTFGSSMDHDRLMDLRATADAVLSGSGTLNTADYDLEPGGERWRELRIQRGLEEFNLRVIVSGSGSINPDAAVFQRGQGPIIILTTDRCPPEKLQQLRQKTPHVMSFGPERIDWNAALLWLREEWGVRRLACEGGGELNAELFAGGLVDRIYLTLCPVIVGGDDAPTIAGGQGVESMDLASQFRLVGHRATGSEIFLEFVSAAGAVPDQGSGR